MHDIGPVVIILLGILFGIFYNQRAIDKVESQLNNRMDKLEARMESSFALVRHTLDIIQSDLKDFTASLASTTKPSPR